MKMKQFSMGFLAVALCLMTACSIGTGNQESADGSVSSAAASQQEPTTQKTNDETATSSAEASASESTGTSAAAETDNQDKTEEEPLLTASFLSDAKEKKIIQDDGSNYLQEMTVDSARVVLGRCDTRHNLEAYLDSYNPDQFDLTEQITVSGNKATHYRWKTETNEDSTVVDAVVTSYGGYSLLFLNSVSADTFAGKTDAGPAQKTVDTWIAGLTVNTIQ